MAEWLQLENGEWFQFSEGATPEQMQQEATDATKQFEQPISPKLAGQQPATGEAVPSPMQEGAGALTTMQNIGRVVPALETAAQVATSAYGIPASGLASLFAAPFGLEAMEKTRQATQKALVYEPQTKGGQQLTEAATYPFQKVEEVGAAAGGAIEKAGYPMTGAAVHTAIAAAPALIAGKAPLKSAYTGAKYGTTVLKNKANIIVKKGIAKGIRPTVVGKRTAGQIKGYYDKAKTAVEEIVLNKENLELKDYDGNPTGNLPKTLDEFSQAIEQTKRNVFQEYDGLATEAGSTGVKINLGETANKLNPVLKNKTLQDFSPETIAYAESRMESLKGRGKYTAAETQEAIALLNQTMEKFYRDPSPQMKGQAFVDALIANDLRKQLDTSISKATGKDYQGLKRTYGALKSMEKEVAHRAVVDARKNHKGLIDFSDIFSGHQIISGMLKAEPSAIAGGAAAKGIAAYIKKLNDPNTHIKNMFKDVDKMINPQMKGPIKSIAADITKTLPVGTASQARREY